MTKTVTIEIRRLTSAADLPLPAYETPGAAGMDLAAALDEDSITLKVGARLLVGTGFAIALPEGFEGQVRPRSGLAARHGVTILNAPGTIDCDYRGEIKVLLVNLGTADFEIQRGMRIAQLVVMPVTRAQWQQADGLSSSLRADGGFGSTGI